MEEFLQATRYFPEKFPYFQFQPRPPVSSFLDQPTFTKTKKKQKCTLVKHEKGIKNGNMICDLKEPKS